MVLSDILIFVAHPFVSVALAPGFVGTVRTVKARLQRRKGPSILQPYRDLARLFAKETVMAKNASPLYRAGPSVAFAATWVAALLVPSISFAGAPYLTADLIALFGLLTLSRFVLTLNGLDIGTAFGGLGASREMLIATLAEPALIMLIFALSLVAGSSNLVDIAAFVQSPAVGLQIALLLAFLCLTMIALAESGRLPVDNPSTHLELTMIHEAMVLEYSGRHLALIEWAGALKLLLYVSLIAALFVPIGIAHAATGLYGLVLAIAFYVAKLAAAAGLLAAFELTVAKLRVFRVPHFIGAALMLALLAGLLRLVSQVF